MLEVDVDTDRISKELLPIVKNKLSNILLAQDYATKVDMLNEEYDWSNISNEIIECAKKTINYLKWIEYINSLYINEITNKIEDISNVEILEISKII